MKCGLKELNKKNVLFVFEKYLNSLENIRQTVKEKSINDDDEDNILMEKLMFAIKSVKSIRSAIRELEEDTTYNSSEIIKLVGEINVHYLIDLRLHSKNIIVAPHLGDLVDDLHQYDVCPEYHYYVFDVEDIMPILEKKMGVKK